MAEETPAAAAPAPTPSQVPDAAATSPASPSLQPSAAPAETPAVEGAKPADVAAPVEGAKAPEAANEKPELHTDKPTLLEGAGKPEEAPKAEEVKPGEVKPDVAPKVEFQPYKIPEGAKVDDVRIQDFNEILTKPDLDPQARGQALLDMHIAELKNYDDYKNREQHRAFSEMRADWQKQVMADPELGGSGFRTTLTAVAKMRDLFVSRHQTGTDGYKKDMDSFNEMLRITGAGDHPATIRFFNNLARRFDEPAAPHIAYKPPPDLGRAQGGKGSRRAALYSEVNK